MGNLPDRNKTLIVDDYGAYRKALRRHLKGDEVLEASSFDEAKEITKEHRPDVIVMDVVFPGEDCTGVDMVEELRGISPESEVILVTGKYNHDDRDRAIEKGAFAYLEKTNGEAVKALADAARRLKDAAKPCSVMVVDDDFAVLQFVRKSLKDCEVTVADGVSTACARAYTTEPDVILLDINMPGVDGLSGIATLRSISPHSLIVMLTSETDPSFRGEAFSRGAHAYCLKSDLPRIRHVVERVQAERILRQSKKSG